MKTVTIKLPIEFAELVRRAVRGYEIHLQLSYDKHKDHPTLEEQYRQERARAATVAELVEAAIDKKG